MLIGIKIDIKNLCKETIFSSYCTSQVHKNPQYDLLKWRGLWHARSEAIQQFCSGRDVFVSLSTGYGKITIYGIIAFDKAVYI